MCYAKQQMTRSSHGNQKQDAEQSERASSKEKGIRKPQEVTAYENWI